MIGIILRSGLTTLIVAAYLFVVGLPLVWRNYSASPTPIPLDLVALEQGRGLSDRHVTIGKHMGYHRTGTATGAYVLFVVGGLPKEAQSIKQSVDAPPTEMARARLILRKPKREWDAKVGDGKRWLREGDTGFISGTAKEMLSPRVRSFMARGLGVPSVDDCLVLESGQRPNLIPGTAAVALAAVLLIFGLYSCVRTVAEITGRSKPLPIAVQDIAALLHVTIALIGFAYFLGRENTQWLLEMSFVYVPVICFVVGAILGSIRLLTYFFRRGATAYP